MLIGELARRTGLSASTLRYYEQEGLLPAPARIGNRRRYDAQVIGRIRIITLARSAGFSIAQTRDFLTNRPAGSIPASRWQATADIKKKEMDALIERATYIKRLLKTSFKCGCLNIEECARLMA